MKIYKLTQFLHALPNWLKIVLTSFTLVLFIWIFNQIDFCIRNLPPGATNGEWSKMITGDEPSIPHNIESLAERNANVVRAVVLSKRNENVYWYRRGTFVEHDIHSVYQIEILETFSGDWEVGDIKYVYQINRMVGETRKHFRPTGILRRTVNYSPRFVRVPIYAGDELILILQPEPGTRNLQYTLNTITGIYRYTPRELSEDDENYVFEPINPHNNRTLSISDLQWLSDYRESAEERN